MTRHRRQSEETSRGCKPRLSNPFDFLDHTGIPSYKFDHSDMQLLSSGPEIIENRRILRTRQTSDPWYGVRCSSSSSTCDLSRLTQDRFRFGLITRTTSSSR